LNMEQSDGERLIVRAKGTLSFCQPWRTSIRGI